MTIPSSAQPSQKQVHYRTCSLCEATCGLEMIVEDGRVTSVRGDREDVFSKGYICPKGVNIASLQE